MTRPKEHGGGEAGAPIAGDPSSFPHDAELARTLVAGGGRATLSTLTAKGYPYGSAVSYSVDEVGAPVLLMSEMAEHTVNARGDAKASLLVAAETPDGADPLSTARLTLVGRLEHVEQPGDLRDGYLEVHPYAAYYADFTDFGFWRLEVEELRFVGGFGHMSWVTAERYAAAEADPDRAGGGRRGRAHERRPPRGQPAVRAAPGRARRRHRGDDGRHRPPRHHPAGGHTGRPPPGPDPLRRAAHRPRRRPACGHRAARQGPRPGLSIAVATTDESIDERADELGEVLASACEQAGVPGAAVGVLVDGEALTAAHGVTNVEHPAPVGRSTRSSRSGRSARPSPRAAVMLLVQDGRLRLDDPVARHLPEPRRDHRPRHRGHHRRALLLSHQAGFDGDHLFVTATERPRRPGRRSSPLPAGRRVLVQQRRLLRRRRGGRGRERAALRRPSCAHRLLAAARAWSRPASPPTRSITALGRHPALGVARATPTCSAAAGWQPGWELGSDRLGRRRPHRLGGPPARLGPLPVDRHHHRRNRAAHRREPRPTPLPCRRRRAARPGRSRLVRAGGRRRHRPSATAASPSGT